MSTRAIVLLADGFEEIEALVPIDLMRRANIEVDIAGVTGPMVKGAHGIIVHADLLLEDVTGAYDCVVLPGGMPGAKNLADSWEVNQLIIQQFNDGRFVAAICAAPAVVLAHAGLLDGRRAVCYPGADAYAPEVNFEDERVLQDGRIITAQGPGCAADFGLKIIEALTDSKTADEVKEKALFISCL